MRHSSTPLFFAHPQMTRADRRLGPFCHHRRNTVFGCWRLFSAPCSLKHHGCSTRHSLPNSWNDLPAKITTRLLCCLPYQRRKTWTISSRERESICTCKKDETFSQHQREEIHVSQSHPPFHPQAPQENETHRVRYNHPMRVESPEPEKMKKTTSGSCRKRETSPIRCQRFVAAPGTKLTAFPKYSS